MDDFTYAKFFVCKNAYNKVKKILEEISSSSEFKGGLEYFLFDDKSSVSIPEVKHNKNNIATFRYRSRTYPSYYSSHLSKHLKKMHGFVKSYY